MARKPKPNSSGRNDDDSAARASRRVTEPEWQKENQSMQTDAPTRWFSAHEYTTSEDTLRTPKAEEKPGIGAPSARQERDAVPNEDTVPREAPAEPRPARSHDRPSPTRRRAGSRSSRDASPRSRRPRQAR